MAGKIKCLIFVRVGFTIGDFLLNITGINFEEISVSQETICSLTYAMSVGFLWKNIDTRSLMSIFVFQVYFIKAYITLMHTSYK